MKKNTFIQLRKKIIEKHFNRMNDSQLEAVFSAEGPLLVLAGAGSGKTTVIVNRIANLVKFGNAYSSEEIQSVPTENDLLEMQQYLAGELSDISEIGCAMDINAVKPWNILAITFTNKAANELKERLQTMLGDDAKDIWASTFHSSCARILRSHASLLGYSSNYTIYDTDDSKRTMKECQRILGIDEKMISSKSILAEISNAKNALISSSDYMKDAQDDFRKKKIAEAYQTYQKLLKSADAMDFDDIIFNAVRLFENHSDVLEHYQNKFKYILVDEYQDTNYAQYRLTALLASRHKNICVVGDDDQSIYRFRGATIENILNFEKQYKNAKVIRLERNYRSTQTILDAANGVIENNDNRKGKSLWTENGDGEKISLYTAYDEQDEGRYIADEISKNVAAGGTWKDHAVLYRMNAQSNTIENAFARSGIPYKIIGGRRFYDRKEIRDAIAYLSVVNNPLDNTRLRRIINEPKRGIGDTSLNTAAEIALALGVSLYEVVKTADKYQELSRASSRLIEFSKIIEELTEKSKTLPLNELFELMLRLSGYLAFIALDSATYTDRLANLNELSNNLLRYTQENEDADLNGFLEDIALISDIDNYNTGSDTVVMMTIHSAKGLEFPNVFIVGLEEGVFPSFQSTYSKSDTEEERRLAYVAITRAEKQLYLTNAKTRMLYGSTSHNKSSRFINEIPEHLIETVSSTIKTFPQARFGGRTVVDTKPYASSRGPLKGSVKPVKQVAYKAGDTVVHKVFGQGVLLSAQSIGNDTLLEIAFEKTGTKKLMANFAKLQILP